MQPAAADVVPTLAVERDVETAARPRRRGAARRGSVSQKEPLVEVHCGAFLDLQIGSKKMKVKVMQIYSQPNARQRRSALRIPAEREEKRRARAAAAEAVAAAGGMPPGLEPRSSAQEPSEVAPPTASVPQQQEEEVFELGSALEAAADAAACVAAAAAASAEVDAAAATPAVPPSSDSSSGESSPPTPPPELLSPSETAPPPPPPPRSSTPPPSSQAPEEDVIELGDALGAAADAAACVAAAAAANGGKAKRSARGGVPGKLPSPFSPLGLLLTIAIATPAAGVVAKHRTPSARRRSLARACAHVPRFVWKLPEERTLVAGPTNVTVSGVERNVFAPFGRRFPHWDAGGVGTEAVGTRIRRVDQWLSLRLLAWRRGQALAACDCWVAAWLHSSRRRRALGPPPPLGSPSFKPFVRRAMAAVPVGYQLDEMRWWFAQAGARDSRRLPHRPPPQPLLWPVPARRSSSRSSGVRSPLHLSAR